MLSRFTKLSLFYNLSLLELRFTTRIKLFPRCIAETQFPCASTKEHGCAITRERIRPYDSIQSCFGRHIKGLFWAADWPGWQHTEQNLQSELKVTGLLHNPLYFSQGGVQRMKTRQSPHAVPYTAYRIKPKGCCLFLPFSLHICREEEEKNTARKCCFRTLQECNRCDRHHWRVAFTIAKACRVAWKTGEKASERKRNLVCGCARGCQGVGHPLVQKSRCRSLPRNSKILRFCPKGRLQNRLRVNKVSKSPPTIHTM